MFQMLIFLVLCYFLNGSAVAERAQPHLHPEVKIVGYNGPLSKEMLTLFRSAELLEFENCNFTSMPGQLYSLLPKLKKIYCNNVTASNIHHEVATGTSNLEEFYYINGTWDDPHFEFWNDFHHLKILIISKYKNSFVKIDANSLNETQLKHLEVSESGIEELDDLAFNNLNKLKTLNLAGNKLTTITKETLTPLKKLKTLDLHGNLLESFGTSQLPNLQHLESIDLSENPLQSLSLENVENIAPNLRKVDLSRTLITEDQLENLKIITKIDIIIRNEEEEDSKIIPVKNS